MTNRPKSNRSKGFSIESILSPNASVVDFISTESKFHPADILRSAQLAASAAERAASAHHTSIRSNDEDELLDVCEYGDERANFAKKSLGF